MPTKMSQRLMDRNNEIHWQVAVRGAIDLLKDSKEEWAGAGLTFGYDFLEEVSNRIYDIIEAGPHAEHDTDVSDDGENNVVMEV